MEADTCALSTVKQYLDQQNRLDTLRFITCGSVDDGKSTLIGRMLFEADLIYEDQVASLKNETKQVSLNVEQIDFSLLVDGLSAEREQGITIDVAYRFFATDKRKFIVADTPGHEQYTRNMITGASNAQLAVILIDARHGVVKQTKRHLLICSILGIRNVVIAVNKMDLVDYAEDVFDRIVDDYDCFASPLNFEQVVAIPMSALEGENIVRRSKNMQWFFGPTLLGYLETVNTRDVTNTYPFRFPVQWVNRPDASFRGFSGTIASGAVSVGQEICVMPTGTAATVKEIFVSETKVNTAVCGMAVTLTLNEEIDVSRGDVIVAADKPCAVSDQFEVKLFWMDQNSGYVGRLFWLKLGTSTVNAQITAIKHKININNFEHLSGTKLDFNDLCVVTLKIDSQIAFERYGDCPTLGAFVLVDRMSNQTVAAGMVEFALRRADNLHLQRLEIDKSARQKLNGHKSKAVWLTGLSGAGKSTIGNALEKALHSSGIRTFMLDGDNVRHGLNGDLGFTEADRVENIRRVGEVAKLMVEAGIVVIVALISPFKAERNMVRQLFADGEFFEVFVDTPLEEAERRDPKGLYKKARNGEIPNFTGINSPYENPSNPEVRVETLTQSVEEAVLEIIKVLGIKQN